MGEDFEIKRYAILASAYLLANISKKDFNRIHSVILFGSVARGDASSESDVDIFFNVDASLKAQKTLRAKLNKLAEEFYLSNSAFIFKMHGISNELSIKVGKLEEWVDLNQSIASCGITLYRVYSATKRPKLKEYLILSWKTPGKAKGALLNKIYGYRVGKKYYSGLLEKYGGIKIGGGAIMIPASTRNVFIEVLERYKINYSRWDMWK